MRTALRLPRRTIALALGGLTLLALALAARHTPSASADAEPALAVRAVTLAAGPAADTGDDAESFAALIHHDREATLAFRIPGRIAMLPVHAGDRLARGALVAAIEPQPYAAALARADADLARAARAADRYTGLAQEGAVATATAHDSDDARAAARAGQDAARYDLASTRLTMPFAGVVLARHGEVGETVGAGQALVSVADSAALLVATAQIPAEAAARLHRGQPAQVSIIGRPALVARILRIAGGAAAGSGTVAVDLVLEGAGAIPSNTPASVRIGASVRIASRERPGAPPPPSTSFAIPAEALLEAEGDRASVYIIDASGHARRRSVRFLGLSDRDARITGLAAGTRVITAGAGFVSEGARVEVAQ